MDEIPPHIVVPQFVIDVLDQFEAKTEAFPEYEIKEALTDAAKSQQDPSNAQRDGWWAESVAFHFSPRRRGDVSEWDTHFGPAGAYTDAKEIDSSIIAHWERRLGECTHPILRARYADLLWDLRRAATNVRPNVEHARAAIDAYIAASKLTITKPHTWQVRWLERALELALSINDRPRSEAAREAMFDLYDRIADPKLLGIWPFLFDNLYGDPKAGLTPAQEKKIIDSLESILDACCKRSNGGTFNPFGAEAAAKRLASHYRKLNKPDEAKRVIRKYGMAFEEISQIASPLLAMSWQQPVFEAYQAEGMTEDATRIQLASKEKGKDAAKEMATISTPIVIKKNDLEAFLDMITAGDLNASLIRIAQYLIPKVADAREHLEWLLKEHPLMTMIGIRKVDAGQIVADVGSLEEDPDGQVLMQLAEHIALWYAFLGSALDRLRERYKPSVDDILAFLFESPLFDADRRGLLTKGIAAYFVGDHPAVAHFLVPQIEHALRRLLALSGQPTNKRVGGSTGVMEEKNLNRILEHESAIGTLLGEDIRLYLLAFLADRRGYNLRNELCHGLMADRQFVRQVSDRLIHILLMLALVRSGTAPEASTPPASPASAASDNATSSSDPNIGA